MNDFAHVPLGRCSATLYHALSTSGWDDGRVKLAACLLKLVHDPDSDADLILHEVGELTPEWAARLQIHQDDPHASAVDSHALAAMLDDHAHRHGSDAWRSAGLLEALLTHPALCAEGRALLPVLSAIPPGHRHHVFALAMARSDENTPPSRFELDDPAYQRAYRLFAPLEVRALLAEAVRQQALVRLYPDGEDAALNACWQALDEDHLSLQLRDHPTSLAALLAAPRVVADSTVSKIKVQFALLAPTIHHHGEQLWLQAPLPDSVLRLQRRDHYRLKLGRAGSLHCQLELWLSDARGHRHRVQVQVQDLSSGGVGFVMDASQPELAPGTRLDDCQLMLDDGCHRVDLLVCNRAHRPPPRPAWHYGCEFLNPPPPLVAQLDHEIMRQTALLR